MRKRPPYIHKKQCWYSNSSHKSEYKEDNIVGKGRKDIPNTGAEKEQTRKEEGKGVKLF